MNNDDTWKLNDFILFFLNPKFNVRHPNRQKRLYAKALLATWQRVIIPEAAAQFFYSYCALVATIMAGMFLF